MIVLHHDDFQQLLSVSKPPSQVLSWFTVAEALTRSLSGSMCETAHHCKYVKHDRGDSVIRICSCFSPQDTNDFKCQKQSCSFYNSFQSNSQHLPSYSILVTRFVRKVTSGLSLPSGFTGQFLIWNLNKIHSYMCRDFFLYLNAFYKPTTNSKSHVKDLYKCNYFDKIF